MWGGRTPPAHCCGGSGGLARKHGHLDPILGAGTNSASASSLLPGRGKPRRGRDRQSPGRAQAPPPAALQPSSTQGLPREMVLPPPPSPPPIPRLSCAEQPRPRGDLQPRFTAQAQAELRAVNPAPLIGARGKFTNEEVGKDGVKGVMEMAPLGAAPLAAASGEDGRASPWAGYQHGDPHAAGRGTPGQPQAGTRSRARAAPGLWCRSQSSPNPMGWGLWGQGAPGQPQDAGGSGCCRPAAGSRGVHNSPPSRRAAAPGVASAGAAWEPARLSPAQHPVLARSSPRRGGGGQRDLPQGTAPIRRWGN